MLRVPLSLALPNQSVLSPLPPARSRMHLQAIICDKNIENLADNGTATSAPLSVGAASACTGAVKFSMQQPQLLTMASIEPLPTSEPSVADQTSVEHGMDQKQQFKAAATLVGQPEPQQLEQMPIGGAGAPWAPSGAPVEAQRGQQPEEALKCAQQLAPEQQGQLNISAAAACTGQQGVQVPLASGTRVLSVAVPAWPPLAVVGHRAKQASGLERTQPNLVGLPVLDPSWLRDTKAMMPMHCHILGCTRDLASDPQY